MEVLHLVSVVKDYMYIFNLFLQIVHFYIILLLYYPKHVLFIVVFWKLGKPQTVKYRPVAVCNAGCERGTALHQNSL